MTPEIPERPCGPSRGSSPGRRHVLGALAVGAVALAGSAACARIPTSGDVQRTSLPSTAGGDVPYVQPRPPADGAGPEQIVTGFVLAGVGPEDDYAVARQYLTGKAHDGWDPGASATLYASGQELEVERLGSDQVRLTLEVVGDVDAKGVRTQPAGPSTRQVDIHVTRTDAGWRISSLPDGIFLSDSYVDILFTAVRLYFLDPPSDHLVPDLRWYSAHRGTSAVLEGLAAGPSEPLAPAVHTAIPDDAQLATATLSQGRSGATEMELPEAIARLPERERDLAIAQIQATLRSTDQLSDVRLVRDGDALAASSDPVLSRALPGHRPIGAGAKGIVTLTDRSGQDGGGQLVPDLAHEKVTMPVIGTTGPVAAALSPKGDAVILASTDGSVPRREVALGQDVVAPDVDDSGYVWTSTAVSTGALFALSPKGSGADTKIEVGWLDGRRIQVLALSPDSTRMLVLSGQDDSQRLDLCAVVRDKDGTPRSITEPWSVATPLATVTRASFYDEAALILLGDDGSEDRALILSLQGENDQLPDPVRGTDRLAGTAVADMTWASTRDGTLLQVDGASWQVIDLPVTDPSFY
jgi:hypothetical protein